MTSAIDTFALSSSISYTHERCSCIYPRAWTCCDGSSRGWLPAGGCARGTGLRHVDRRRWTRYGPPHPRRPKRPSRAWPSPRAECLLRQVHQLGLTDVGADAEIDIIQAGTDLAEFYRLSQAALCFRRWNSGPSGLGRRRQSLTDQATMTS